MPQPRARILTFAKSPPPRLVSSVTKLPLLTSRRPRVPLRSSPQFVAKAARLHAIAPEAAAFVEELINDLLAEVS